MAHKATTLEDPKLGIHILRLLESTSQWVRRRVETVEFRDQATACRKVSVDFELPADGVTLKLDSSKEVRLVPLALLKKEKLTNFDLCDEGGASLPMLTTPEVSNVMSAALIEMARTAINGTAATSKALEPAIEEDIRMVVGEKLSDSTEILRNWPTGGGGQRQKIKANKSFWQLLHEFSRLRVVLVPLEEHTRRRILKFQYEELFKRGPAKLLPKLRWRPLRTEFETPGAEDAESYHFEVLAPEGVDFTEASLLAGRESDLAAKVDRAGGGTPRVHLRVHGVTPRSNANVQTMLRATRRGWLTAAWLCSSVIAVMLFAGAYWVNMSFEQPGAGVTPTSNSAAQSTTASGSKNAIGAASLAAASGEPGATKAPPITTGEQDSSAAETTSAKRDAATAAAALLLVLPAVAATLMVRPQEHAMAARLLSVVRPLLVVASVLTYFAAVTLVFGPSGSALRKIWIGLAIAGGLQALLVTVSMFLPRIKTAEVP